MGFDAGTVGLIAGGVGAASSGVNAYGQYNANQAQGNAMLSRGQTSAAWEQIRAQDAARRGQLEMGRSINQTRQIQGAARVAAAGNNADVATGSPAQLVSQTGTLGALDRLTIENNAYLEALGYRSQAQNYLFQGTMGQKVAQNKANNSLLQGVLGANRDFYKGASIYGATRVPQMTQDQANMKTAFDQGYISEAEYRSGIVG